MSIPIRSAQLGASWRAILAGCLALSPANRSGLTNTVADLHAKFEASTQTETEGGTEFWLARDLQTLFGYERWENFAKVIDKATTACEKSGYEVADHFLEITKMVEIGSGAKREVEDVMLSRYACYLIAQNGDPGKDQIAFAQTYFAVQTRKMEIIEQRLLDVERLSCLSCLSWSFPGVPHYA